MDFGHFAANTVFSTILKNAVFNFQRFEKYVNAMKSCAQQFWKKWLEAENYLAGFNAQKMLHAMNGRQKFPKTCFQKIEANSFQKLAVRPTSSASFLNFAVSTTAFRPIVGEGLRIQNRRARNEHVCQIMCRGGCVNFIQFFLVWTCVCVRVTQAKTFLLQRGGARSQTDRVPRKCSLVLWGNISFDS